MRILVKRDRKRYFGKALYEYERLYVPIPARHRELVRQWVGRDLKIVVEPLSYGFALLVAEKMPYIKGLSASHRFRMLIRSLEPDSGAKTRDGERF